MNPVRKPNRKPTARKRRGCWHESAVNYIAAFAIELVAGFQVPLGYRHDIATKSCCRPGGFSAQTYACNRDAEFQPDQMIRPVQSRVVPAFIGREPVLLEAAAKIITVRGKSHIHAPPEVTGNLPAVALEAGNNFDLSPVVQHAALVARTQGARQVVRSARRKGEAIGCRNKTGGISDRRHLDGGLGPVEEGVEHLRVEVSLSDHFRAEAIVIPDRLG